MNLETSNRIIGEHHKYTGQLGDWKDMPIGYLAAWLLTLPAEDDDQQWRSCLQPIAGNQRCRFAVVPTDDDDVSGRLMPLMGCQIEP